MRQLLLPLAIVALNACHRGPAPEPIAPGGAPPPNTAAPTARLPATLRSSTD